MSDISVFGNSVLKGVIYENNIYKVIELNFYYFSLFVEKNYKI